MRTFIQDDPDREHDPEVGDDYLEHNYGVVVTVVEVTEDRVKVRNVRGWTVTAGKEWFKNNSRRILREG